MNTTLASLVLSPYGGFSIAVINALEVSPLNKGEIHINYIDYNFDILV